MRPGGSATWPPHAVLAELATRSRERDVSPSLLAQVHAGLGEVGEALAWLERAKDVRAVDLA